jgi:hypothetical protein
MAARRKDIRAAAPAAVQPQVAQAAAKA